MQTIVGKDSRPDKDAEAVILTKYIVSPDRGLEFIKAFKLVSLTSSSISSVMLHHTTHRQCATALPLNSS